MIRIGPSYYYRQGIALTYITEIVLALVPYNYALVSVHPRTAMLMTDLMILKPLNDFFRLTNY